MLLRGAFTAEQACLSLQRFADDIGDSTIRSLEQLLSSPPLLDSAASERAAWPAHIVGTGLDCYIVPIQPRWAKELFDIEMAGESLFPSDPALLLRFENAYYRAAKPEAVRSAPARVLWYVSDTEGERHSKQIRASSLVRSGSTGKAKDLFKRYARYGVFDWGAVSTLAGGPDGTLTAFSFSHTTLLRRPIPFDQVFGFLQARLNRTYTFQSPVAVPEDLWMELYALGTDIQPEQ